MILNFNKFIRLKLTESINYDKVESPLAHRRISSAYTRIMSESPFLADLMNNLEVVEADKDSDIDTMATDGKRIMYSPDYVIKMFEGAKPEDNTYGNCWVLLHELLHNANKHFARQGDKTQLVQTPNGQTVSLWNIATDYAINLQLEEMIEGLTEKWLIRPPNVLFDKKYVNMSAEAIYYQILDEIKGKGQGQGQGQPGKPGQPGQGKPGQGQPGQGQPGQGQPGQGMPGQGQPGQGQPGDGEPIPMNIDPNVTPSLDDIRKAGSLKGGTPVFAGKADFQEQNNAKLGDLWDEVRNAALSRYAGTGSQALDRAFLKIRKAKVDWKRELHKFVSDIYTKFETIFPNRRHVWKEEYYPVDIETISEEFDDVVVAIDTSGSITDETLAKFASELVKIFNEFNIDDCHILWCDADIRGVQKFTATKKFTPDALKPKGGGGTSFIPPFDWIQKNILKKGKDPAFVIYFTDAYGTAPKLKDYNIADYVDRLLWVITDNMEASEIPKNLGKKIFLDKYPD